MIARERLLMCLTLVACGGGGGGGTTAETGSSGETTAGTGASFPGTTSADPTGDVPTSGTTVAPTTTAGTSTSSTGEVTSTGATTVGETGATTTTGGVETTGSTTSTETGTSTTSGTESTDTTEDESTSSTTSTGTTELGTSESGTTVVVGECGDGKIDPGEQCDDGDDDDKDTCGNDCVLATCSDGEQNGGETAVDCGGMCEVCPFALLIGGNATKMVGASFDGASWTSSDIAAPTVDGLDVTIFNGATGLGLFRYTKINDAKDNQLQYVTWKAGLWSAPQQVGTDKTRSAPTVSGSHVVFQGEDYKFYYAAYDGMGWNPSADGFGSSFGPGPGSVTQVGVGALFVFHDGADFNHFKAQKRVASWMGSTVVDIETQAFDRQPAVTTIAVDTVLAVHAINNGGQLKWSVATGGVWSAPATIAGAQTSAAPALVAFGDGDAALAFRGNDGKAYVATFDGAAWAAAKPIGEPNPSVYGPPALAAGIGAADLELLYLDAGSKVVKHVRRIGGTWTAAVQIGNTALERVAIASAP